MSRKLDLIDDEIQALIALGTLAKVVGDLYPSLGRGIRYNLIRDLIKDHIKDLKIERDQYNGMDKCDRKCGRLPDENSHEFNHLPDEKTL